MTLAIWYWLVLVLTVVFGGWGYWAADPPARTFRSWGIGLPLLILFIIIGFALFGSPVK
jgi:hypothetical protein